MAAPTKEMLKDIPSEEIWLSADNTDLTQIWLFPLDWTSGLRKINRNSFRRGEKTATSLMARAIFAGQGAQIADDVKKHRESTQQSGGQSLKPTKTDFQTLKHRADSHKLEKDKRALARVQEFAVPLIPAPVPTEEVAAAAGDEEDAASAATESAHNSRRDQLFGGQSGPAACTPAAGKLRAASAVSASASSARSLSSTPNRDRSSHVSRASVQSKVQQALDRSRSPRRHGGSALDAASSVNELDSASQVGGKESKIQYKIWLHDKETPEEMYVRWKDLLNLLWGACFLNSGCVWMD